MFKQKTEWRILNAGGSFYIQKRVALFVWGVRIQGFFWKTITRELELEKAKEYVVMLKKDDPASYEPEENIPC